jgi:hypothetical protein
MAKSVVEYILKISTKGAISGLDKAEKAVKELGEGFEDSADKSKDSSKKMVNGLADIQAGLQMGVGALQKFAGAVIATAEAMFDFTRESVDMINDLGDIANRSGVAAETIGALKAAFHASGQEAGAVVAVLDVTAKRFAQIAKGNKEAEESFAKYGIAVRDTNGKMKSNNELLLESMHVIQGLSETSERSRASLILLGRGGQQLSQALGAGAFDKFLEFTQKFGAKAGPKAAKEAALFQDSLSLMNVAFEGLRQTIVEAMDGMAFFARGMQALMALFAGLKNAIQGNEALVNGFISSMGTLLNKLIGLFSWLLNMGFESTNEGLQGLLENIVLVGAGIIRFVLKPLIAIMAQWSGFVGMLYSEDLGMALAGATNEMIKFHKALDPAENSGFLNFQKFSVGVADSLKTFSEITAGASHELGGFEEELQDVKEEAEETVEAFNALEETIKLVSGSLSGLGLPESLTPEGIQRSIDKVSLLGAGIAQIGEEQKLTASRFLKTDPNSVAKQFGSALMTNAEAFGSKLSKGMGLIQLFRKFINFAAKLGERGETVSEIQLSVEQQIKNRAKAIELGLKALPPILFETLPPLLTRFASELVVQLGQLFSDMIVAFVQAIRDLFPSREGAETAAEEHRNFIKAFINAISFGGDVFRSGGNFIPSAKSGIRFTGANEGLALLHRGEYVVPETGQAPQQVQRDLGMGMGGNGIVINIQAQVVEQNAIDELVRQIERRFQTFGQSTSTLFGS